MPTKPRHAPYGTIESVLEFATTMEKAAMTVRVELTAPGTGGDQSTDDLVMRVYDAAHALAEAVRTTAPAADARGEARASAAGLRVILGGRRP